MLIQTNLVDMRNDILKNFVGTMGWLDTFLPETMVYLYLVVLLLTALLMAEKDVRIDWKRKLLLLFMFIAGVAAIEGAMYIYSTVVGNPKLFGVQGRYFIPLAPLFLLVWYNPYLSRKLNFLANPKRLSYAKAKTALKPKILHEIEGEQLFSKYLQLFILGFTVLVLIRGIAAVLLRYYQW
jgi:uncharacterized membrane protein